MPFVVKDVSMDRAAAMEMMRRTRQNGVPVIADEQEAIVGFDVPRLRAMAARHVAPSRPSLGAMAKDAPGGSGARVGGIRPGSAAERGGVVAGDVIEELSGQPVRTTADLARIAGLRSLQGPTSARVRRGQDTVTLVLPPG